MNIIITYPFAYDIYETENLRDVVLILPYKQMEFDYLYKRDCQFLLIQILNWIIYYNIIYKSRTVVNPEDAISGQPIQKLDSRWTFVLHILHITNAAMKALGFVFISKYHRIYRAFLV